MQSQKHELAGRATFLALQRFSDYKELEARFARQSAVSFARIAPLRGERSIEIPMPWRLALL